MLSRADNERLTRVGPGTPMGELMRRYWIPAAFSHQIAKPDSPPIRVRLLGEDLVALPRHQRPHRPSRRALPAPHRFAVLRPQRGGRSALRLSRPEIRRRGRLHRCPLRSAGGRRRARAHQDAAQDARLSLHRAWRSRVDLYGPARAQAGIPRSRMDAGSAGSALRHAPHPGVQLAARRRRRLRCDAPDLPAWRRHRTQPAHRGDDVRGDPHRFRLHRRHRAAIRATAPSCGTPTSC